MHGRGAMRPPTQGTDTMHTKRIARGAYQITRADGRTLAAIDTPQGWKLCIGTVEEYMSCGDGWVDTFRTLRGAKDAAKGLTREQLGG